MDRRVTCRKLWTGSGRPLSGVSVQIAEGSIQEISDAGGLKDFDFDFGMPAFFDAHCHMTWMVLKELSLDLSKASSAGDLVEKLASAAKSWNGTVLRGESWDESGWAAPGLPSLAQIDRATGDVPVFLCRVCGHKAIVNSAMLSMIPEDSDEVDRKRGLLLESQVLNFTRRFPPDREVLRRSMASVVSRVHSMGVTGICTIEKPEHIDLIRSSEPDLDVSYVIQTRPPWTRGGGYRGSTMTKFFLDGSFGAGTAALDTGSSENLLYNDNELHDALLSCGRSGLQPVVHAIGASALSQLDRVSRRVRREVGGGFTMRIEHAEDILRVWPGGFDPSFQVFSMQPNFVERWQRPGGMYDRLLGEERSLGLNPIRTIMNAGFGVCFGSDSMPLDPLYGLLGAVHHRRTSESLTPGEALKLYTTEAARHSGRESLARPLERGRQADMVFLTGDPFESLQNLQVECTLRGGRTVYRRESDGLDRSGRSGG